MNLTNATPHQDASASEQSVKFLNLHFTKLSDEEILKKIRELADLDRFSYVITPNVDHIVKLNQPPFCEPTHEIHQAYADAALRVCDSRILVQLAGASRIILPAFSGSGSNMTRIFLEQWLRPGDRVALIGGTAEQLQWLCSRWPNIEFLQHIPPMGVLGNREAQLEIATFVETARCDINLFALGAPQSELVCGQIFRRGKARGVALCIGASIDFLTGTKRYAPLWVHEHSLEWAFRLLTEPRRLWKRYLVHGPKIFLIWWRDQRQSST